MTTVGRTLGRRTAGAARAPRLALRHLWLIPGLAIGLAANVVSGEQHLGLVPVLLFGIAPHLPVLLGIGQPHADGQMPRRAVPVFNAMHHPAPPLVVLGLAGAGILSPFWFVAGLAWLGHIVVDEGFGKGSRSVGGWRRGSVAS